METISFSSTNSCHTLKTVASFYCTDFTQKELRHKSEIRLETQHLPLRTKPKNTVELQFPVVAGRQISY